MKISEIDVSLIDKMGTDLSVVNAARVSFDKESEYLSDKDQKLIKYLAKHQHKSPFNHCFLSFRVKAPIFVARQLVKHKFLPWNEVSRRYVDSEPEFYMPEHWRKKADNVKQGSSTETIPAREIKACIEWTLWGFEDGCYYKNDSIELSAKTYEFLLEQGVCPEQARMVLPQNTMTEWIWSGSLGAFADMCRLRLDSHTQVETQYVAAAVAEHLREAFPVSFSALMEV